MDQKPGMTTSKAYLFILLLAIVFLSGGIAYLNFRKPQTTPVRVTPTVVTKPTARPLPKETVVKLTPQGFVPQVITVNTGEEVRWVNESGKTNATVNSSPYPLNNEHKELNLGAFNGSTLAHLFTKPDTYEYHDYFHPEWTGTVVVK